MIHYIDISFLLYCSFFLYSSSHALFFIRLQFASSVLLEIKIILFKRDSWRIR